MVNSFFIFTIFSQNYDLQIIIQQARLRHIDFSVLVIRLILRPSWQYYHSDIKANMSSSALQYYTNINSVICSWENREQLWGSRILLIYIVICLSLAYCKLCSKALQVPSSREGCVIPITMPFLMKLSFSIKDVIEFWNNI